MMSYAICNDTNECNSNHFLTMNSGSNRRINRGKGLLIPVTSLIAPPAPSESIASWWHRQLAVLPAEMQSDLKSISRRNKSREFYIVIVTVSGDGNAWFGIRCTTNSKQRIPVEPDLIDNWVMDAVCIKAIAKDTLIPRAGGLVSLQSKKACLVGCGSLGGYVADMLCSSGIGHLTLIDDDFYKIENIHRHMLDPNYLYSPKVDGLKFDLEHKYPFLTVKPVKKKMLSIKDPDFWKKFDVIIVATGSPTHERKFNEYVNLHDIAVPVVYSWTEPFGVGGHAVTTTSGVPGCLACSYINNENDEPGLYPNINFIQQNQNVMASIDGCGTEFLAFSSVDSIQTATIATKLAIKCVNGVVNQGNSISWKGDPELATATGVKLTHRYWRFKGALQNLPIARESCVVCQ
jgi:molybdopterin/thiamine biosynthesis adenylyltransferase